MGLRLSSFPNAGLLDGTELVGLVQGGETVKAQVNDIAIIAKGPPGSAGEGYPTRIALSDVIATDRDDAYLAEPGREGKFVFDSSNFVTKLGASLATIDPQQGLYIAPASDPTGALGAWVRKFSGALDARWLGAKCDAVADGSSGTDDTAAINAAIALLESRNGGDIFIPAHTTCDGIIALNSKHHIRLVGPVAGGGGYGIFPPAQLIYRGTGARFIDARSSFAVKLHQLGVRYTSSSFTGDLIDYSHETASDATYGMVSECLVGGMIGLRSARRCISLLDAIICTVKDNHISDAQVGVGGKLESSPGFSNSHIITGNTFDNLAVSAILNAGEKWTVDKNTFEGSDDGSGGMPRAYYDDFSLAAGAVTYALSFTNNWLGDSGATTDAWFCNGHTEIRGLKISGNLFDNQFGGGVGVKLTQSCFGAEITGNRLSSVDLGSVPHFGLQVTGNSFVVDYVGLTTDSRDIWIGANSVNGVNHCASVLRLSNPQEFGFGIDSGVTVNQPTDRTTLITANAMSGQINLFVQPGSAAWSQFQVNNSFVKQTDTVQVCQHYTGSADTYEAFAVSGQTGGPGTGFFIVHFRTTGGTATEAIPLNFTVHSGSNS